MNKAIALAFEEFGEPDTPALVIVHGLFASSRNWRQIARKLAVQRHVFVLDMRNHGNSAHSARMDYPSMAADIELFITTQQLEDASILGHSMGGKAAMWLALSNPECFGELIVADIAPLSYRHSFDNIIQALMQLPLAQLSNRKQADEYLSAPIPDSGFRQFLLQNLLLIEGKYQWRIDLDIFAKTVDNIIAFPDVEGRDAYTDKVLFLAGETSNYIDRDNVCALFPRAEIQTIAQAGHWLHAEQPEAFCNAVNDYLVARMKPT